MTAQVINIDKAELAGAYKLRLQFDDGIAQLVDFEPFLRRARHPEIRSFLEPTRFAQFRVEAGDLVWGEYELCFPIHDLYKNHIDKLDETCHLLMSKTNADRLLSSIAQLTTGDQSANRVELVAGKAHQ